MKTFLSRSKTGYIICAIWFGWHALSKETRFFHMSTYGFIMCYFVSCVDIQSYNGQYYSYIDIEAHISTCHESGKIKYQYGIVYFYDMLIILVILQISFKVENKIFTGKPSFCILFHVNYIFYTLTIFYLAFSELHFCIGIDSLLPL